MDLGFRFKQECKPFKFGAISRVYRGIYITYFPITYIDSEKFFLILFIIEAKIPAVYKAYK